MAKQVTLADVARRSNVSVSTASLALRNKPGIPEETRLRVYDAAQALGYKPRSSPAARAAQQRPGHRLQNLGLLLKSESGDPARANPFYSQVLAGIEDVCRRRKINLLYATLPVDDDNRPTESPVLLSEKHADGLLLVGAFVDETLGHVIGEAPLPVVLVDGYSTSNAYDSVVSDNYRGAYQAVGHLIQCGHRQIGMVGSHAEAYPSLRERREGYLRALADHGIETSYFADAPLHTAAMEQAAARLLRDEPQITALFGCNDHATLAAMHAAQAAGRRLPHDLSLMGFDDIELSKHVQPPLTTMHVDKVGMGRLAVHLLMNRLDYPEAEQITAVICTRLVERGSVAAPRT